MESKIPIIASVVGFFLMLAGFIAYVASPATAYETVFVVGVVLLTLGYGLVYMGNRLTMAEARRTDAEEWEGFFYIMDENYSAPAEDARIEDLTRMED